MNIEKLEKNLRDLILEEQVKLGYRKELLRLYYPLSSLNHLLEVDCTEKEMLERMKEFSEATRAHFGGITVSSQKERFCIQIPPEGVEYVHEHQGEDDFLVKFIETIACHGCTLQDVETLFTQYSDQVFEGSYAGDDFDYLFYFRDNKPNDYRYCITFEGRHVIYHRFTPEDYVDYDFGEVIPVKGE